MKINATPHTDAVDHGLSSWHLNGVMTGAYAVMLENARNLEREVIAWRDHGKTYGFKAGIMAGTWVVVQDEDTRADLPPCDRTDAAPQDAKPSGADVNLPAGSAPDRSSDLCRRYEPSGTDDFCRWCCRTMSEHDDHDMPYSGSIERKE